MNIFVAKLSSSTTGDDLRELFGRFGEVVRSSVVLDRETGESRGFGFVEMRDDDAARSAIEELDGFTFNGRAMVVKEAEDRRGGGGSSGPPRERRSDSGDRPPRPDRGEPRDIPPPSMDEEEGGRRERGWSKDKPKRAAEPERKPKKSSLKAPDKSMRKQPKKGRWVDDFEDDY